MGSFNKKMGKPVTMQTLLIVMGAPQLAKLKRAASVEMESLNLNSRRSAMMEMMLIVTVAVSIVKSKGIPADVET